ncbi:MAG: 2'-5' RNA ligase family protein [Promicromonosporaceae bacterium]|nr:2'-5' RNA ligase family protein [Promicromonosporaceae bacterium]
MHLPAREQGESRIGVSIAVPEPYAAELVAARRRAGDQYAAVIPPHVTLVGPTVVDSLAAVEDHLAVVAAAATPFRLHLRGTGTFRPISPVVFINVVQGIAECEQLERRARRGPLAQDLRFNYHPHVTIAHEVSSLSLERTFNQMSTFEAAFTVEEFWLYEHGNDDVWRPRRSFPLGLGGLFP